MGWFTNLFRKKHRDVPPAEVNLEVAKRPPEPPPWADYEWVNGVLPQLFGEPAKFFHSRIAGVTFPNPDGFPSRMDVIRRCNPGELLLLLTGLFADFPESVLVTQADGSPLGFLPKEIAHEMRGEVDRWQCCFQYGTHAEDSNEIAGASVCLMRLVDPAR